MCIRESAQSTKPSRFGDLLWEGAAVSMVPDWQAVMCCPGRQKDGLGWEGAVDPWLGIPCWALPGVLLKRSVASLVLLCKQMSVG